MLVRGRQHGLRVPAEVASWRTEVPSDQIHRRCHWAKRRVAGGR